MLEDNHHKRDDYLRDFPSEVLSLILTVLVTAGLVFLLYLWGII